MNDGLRRTWTARCVCGREVTVDAVGRYSTRCGAAAALCAVGWLRIKGRWTCPDCLCVREKEPRP